MPNIKLKSAEGDIFDVDIDVARCSETIATMLDNLGVEKDKEEIIPVANVNSRILEKVICWATYHKNDPPQPEQDPNIPKRTDDICQWDMDFLTCDQATLFDLIMAANYLHIKGLMEVCCKTVANMIKGKSPEQIRKMFNIKNDLTPEEEAQIKKENAWEGGNDRKYPNRDRGSRSY